MRFIGLDIGTTSLSAVAIDGENGKILKAITVDNDTAVPSCDPDRRMQDPVIIIDKLLKLKNALVNEFAPLDSIGITGQMYGILYLDKDGNPVSPLYTWQDASGSKNYKESTYAKYLAKKTSYNLASGYGLVTDYVNRDLGEIPETAVTFCTVHDFAVMALTHLKTPLVHSSDAASLCCISIIGSTFDA